MSVLFVTVALLVIGDSFDGYEPIYEINRSCIWKFQEFWLAMEVGWTVTVAWAIYQPNNDV